MTSLRKIRVYNSVRLERQGTQVYEFKNALVIPIWTWADTMVPIVSLEKLRPELDERLIEPTKSQIYIIYEAQSSLSKLNGRGEKLIYAPFEYNYDIITLKEDDSLRVSPEVSTVLLTRAERRKMRLELVRGIKGSVFLRNQLINLQIGLALQNILEEDDSIRSL